MRTLIFLGCFVLALFATGCSNNPDLAWPKVEKEAKPATRWWWLGSAVDKENLSYNLKELSGAGFGAVEITPIYGVQNNEAKNIDYLSPEWMAMLKYCIEQGKKLGISIDMATGTGWPFGGPQIEPKNAATLMRFGHWKASGGKAFSAKMEVLDNRGRRAPDDTLLHVMARSSKGEQIEISGQVGADSILRWTPPAGSWDILAMFSGKTRQAVKRAAPGGKGLVMDHFSREALDVYLARFEKAFADNNNPVPATFFNDSYEVYNADWSPVFFSEFRKRRGYALEDYLFELSGMSKDTLLMSRVKSDYRETMSDVLLENFTQPWTAWVHKMGSKNRNQAHGSPANLLDLYATVDIPECETFGMTVFDIPGQRREEAFVRKGDADPMMLKFATSAAHVGNKKYASSETFTWLAEHFRVSLSQCKPELDQLFLAGVNHVYFHGTPYSPKEAAWPGWQFYASVNFSPTNVFWRDISGLTGYIARCQSFLQSGTPDNDFLLYWPIFDVWNNPEDTDIPMTIHGIEVWMKPTAFYQIATYVKDHGYDFDYVSDRQIQSAIAADGSVTMGQVKYKAIIVPDCKVMPVETLRKLYDLMNAGAKVVFVNRFPTDVPGLGNRDAKILEFAEIRKAMGFTPNSVLPRINPLGLGELITGSAFNYPGMFREVGVRNEPLRQAGINFLRRRHDQGYLYFLANQKRATVDRWITLSVEAQSAVLFDPISGASGVAQLRQIKGRTQVLLQMKSNQSLILKTFSSRIVKGDAWPYLEPKGEPLKLQGTWKVSFNGTPAINESFDISELSSWTGWNDSLKIFSGTGTYTVKFQWDQEEAQDWLLSLGKVAESARVKLNGKDLGVWWSIPFERNVGSWLKKGSNTLEVQVTNIDANRIAGLDKKGVVWQKFEEINFVNVNYEKFTTAGWEPMPSGLLGPVTITPLNARPESPDTEEPVTDEE